MALISTTMSRRKSQMYIELPPVPLSRRNDNARTPHSDVQPKSLSARPSLSGMRVETSKKSSSSSKTQNATDTQNIEPDPNTTNGVVKRKRSTSDLTGGSASNAKKPRAKPENKPGTSAKSLEVGPTASQPKWIPISTAVSYDEIMERMQLREFLARFQSLTKFAQTHLDTLSQLSVPNYQYLPRATLKAILLALLDLVGADASSDVRRGCQAAIKHIRGARGNLDVIWDSLAELRRASFSKLPSPERLPNNVDHHSDEESDDGDEPAGRVTRRASKLARLAQPAAPPKDTSIDFPLICGAQFLSMLVFLAEVALHTPSVRSDIDMGLRTFASAAHKSHAAKLAEERARWTEQRQTFTSGLSALEATKSQEKAAKGGKAARGSAATLAKIKELKVKRKTAEAKHQQILRGLRVAYNLELRACAGRGTFLGSDRSGRLFFALSSPPKFTPGEDRWTYWSTFVACWGKKTDELKPHWYGFDDPSELRKLAGALEGDTGSGPPPADSLAKSLTVLAELFEDGRDD